ncbi:DUF1798 family protein [Neobacillus sp. FSL H8-0543]|uniref:DUF1798 family protein n=1 Tax=Neobacillus sp. FSL H8-0543 TaxID=2954672 RepID=UPI003158FD65
MIEEIAHLTKKLLDFNRLCLEYYEKARETGVNEDFNEVVRPFANEVKFTITKWSIVMQEWLKQSPKKHLHLKQIGTTSDHLEQISIQAFFPKTSRTRFLNANRTVEFFLLEILKELEE